MSSNKSFSTETSERYALALYELSSESSEIDNIEKNVTNLLQLYNTSTDLENFIKNPTKKIHDQLLIVKEVSNAMKFNKIFENFLSLLVTKRRIFFLKKILNSFRQLSSKRKGEVNASLISSKELTKEELLSINTELSKTIGSTINFNYQVDKGLIGGLKIQLGSLMIDSSIKNKLKKYETLMLEN